MIDGQLDEHFPLVVWQTGSGTDEHERQRGHRQSRHRARRAGVEARRSRSTPTITSTAASRRTTRFRPRCTSRSSPNCARSSRPCVALRETLEAKAEAFAEHRQDRPHASQDATPLTLGQEIGGWAAQLGSPKRRLPAALEGVYELAHRRHSRRHRPERHPGSARLARAHRRADRPAVPLAPKQVRRARRARRSWSRAGALDERSRAR